MATPRKRSNGHASDQKSSQRLGASIDPSGKLRIATREKSFQQKIEKMQLQIVTKEFGVRKAVARGLKELVNARKMEAMLAEHNVKPLSDYSHLREIYDAELKTITPADLQREAEAKAEQFLTGGNKVSAAQEKVVRDLYALEAKTNELGIEHVKEFLIIKGQIKEQPEDKKRMHEKQKLVEEIAA